MRVQKRSESQMVDVIEMDEETLIDIIKVFIHESRHFECFDDGAYKRLIYWHNGREKNVLIRLER